MFEPYNSRHEQFARVLLLVTPALWSFNYIVARAAPGIIEPHLLALLRWSMAFCIMLPFALPEIVRAWPRWRREWRDVLLLGLLGMWICGAILYIAGRTTEAVNIALYYSMAPVLVAIGANFLFNEKLRWPHWAGIALAFAGMLVILSRGAPANLIGLSDALQFTIGDVWAIIAMTSWATYCLILRGRESVLGPFARLTVITAGGVLVLIPLTLIEVAVAGVPANWLPAFGLASVAALLPGFGAYQAYSYMQHHLGAARAGVVLYLMPLYSAVLAWWLLSEQPGWYHVAGAALILPGVYFATRR